jgi:hypothetical protein
MVGASYLETTPMTSTFHRYARLTTMLALLVTAAACSSDSNPAGSDGSGTNNGSNTGNSSVTNCTTQSNACMTALIDGRGLTSTNSAAGFGSYGGGLLVVAGGDTSYALAFALFVSSTGSVSIPGSGTNVGKNAQLTSTGSNASWSASASGGSGTVTVTSLTSTTIAGTFNFTVVPVAGTGATGNHAITNGTFFLRY